MSVKEIEKAALSLSKKERAVLSYKLLESIDGDEQKDVDDIWMNAVNERYSQLKSDESKLKDASKVIKEAKSKYE